MAVDHVCLQFLGMLPDEIVERRIRVSLFGRRFKDGLAQGRGEIADGGRGQIAPRDDAAERNRQSGHLFPPRPQIRHFF